jgi:lactate permease
MTTQWPQVYDPLGNAWLSTLCAAVPVVVLLGALALFRVRAHVAALLGLAAALVGALAGSVAARVFAVHRGGGGS